jgi:hypothetical protein
VDAPHEQPLEAGQAVAMRAWWRHYASNQQQQPHSTCSSSELVEQPQHGRAVGVAVAPLAARQLHHRASGMPALCETGACPTLASLHRTWVAHGGFDAILGFYNGAAARMRPPLALVTRC